MSSIEWYYAHDGVQAGPVSAADLKQLAEIGQLKPEDLVWRDGMNEWIVAGKVKGLFDGESPARPTVTAPVATPPGVAPPSATATAAPPVSAPANAVAAPPPNGTRSPAPSPAARAPKAAAPAFESSTAAYERSREDVARQFLDVLLDVARARLSPGLVARTAVLFNAVGRYGLYAAMVLGAVLGVILSIMNRTAWGAVTMLSVAAVLGVLCYAAGRFASAMHRLDRAIPCRLASSALPDCFALVHAVLGLVALVALTVQAAQYQAISLVLPGMAIFIVASYAAASAINPATLHTAVATEASAKDEALGVFTFLIKVLVRTVPVAFGVGVAWGVAKLLLAYVVLLVPAEDVSGLQPFLGAELPTASAQAIAADSDLPRQVRIVAATVATSVASGILIAAAVLPIAAYVLFLLAHLVLESLRAVIFLPEQLGRLAEQKEDE